MHACCWYPTATSKRGLGNQHDLVGRFNEHPHTFYAQILDTENNRFRGILIPSTIKLMLKTSLRQYSSLRQEVMRKNKLLNSCAILVNRPDYKLGTDYNSLTGVSLSRLLAELFSHNSFIKPSTSEGSKKHNFRSCHRIADLEKPDRK